MRRTILIAALFVLGFASGAMAQKETRTYQVDIDFPPLDTANALVANGLATSQINDSLWFFSREFYHNGPWSNLLVNFVTLTKDTATATGLCRDSVTITLETRLNNDSIKIWRRIGATSKYPLAAWDSTGLATLATITTNTEKLVPQKAYPSATSLYTGAATGVGGPYRGIPSARINLIEADSAAAFGEIYRFAVLYNAEEDSLKSHVALKSNSTIDILNKLRAIVTFRAR